MVKFITKTICVALIATLCVGVNAQNAPQRNGLAAKKAVESDTPKFSSAKASVKDRAVAFFEDFNTGTGYDHGMVLPAGWALLGTNNGTEWETVDYLTDGSGNPSVYSYDNSIFATSLWNGNVTRNSWMISPSFFLTAGEEYTVSFWMKLSMYTGEVDKIEVKIGTAQTIDAMNAGDLIYKNETTPVSSWTLMEFPYVPTASGNFYIGLHAYSPANQGNDIDIDDVKITGGAPQPPCDPITNLQAEIQGTDVKLTWTAAPGSPTGYKVYDGATVLGTVTETEYVAKKLGVGEHTLGVEAIYDNGCLPVKVTKTVDIQVANPIKNLSGSCIDGTLNLTWTEPDAMPSGFNDWLTYATGDYAGGLGTTKPYTMAYANRWSPADLAAKGITTGAELKKVTHFFNTQFTGGITLDAADYVIKVWQGSSSTQPGTEKYTSPTMHYPGDLVDYEWNEITLATPIVIDASLELWIGVDINVTAGVSYACAYCAGTTVSGVNMLRWNSAWQVYNDFQGGGNWALKGFVVSTGGTTVELTHYDVYQDDSKLGQSTTTTFTKAGMPDGKSNYCIVAVYDNDAQSDKVCKEITCVDCPAVTGAKVAFNNCTATIAWTAAEDAKEYKIVRDGVDPVFVDASPYVETAAFEDGVSYIWKIITICNSGKESAEVAVSAVSHCNTPAVEELANSIAIFPNPSNSTVNIQATDFAKVEVYNTVGQLIETRTVNIVDVSTYNTGIYFFKVYDNNNNSVTKRVMVTK